MSQKTVPQVLPEFTGLDEALLAELPTFELFFRTFGFKRVHGRVWGLLVLAGQPLTMREICAALGLSQGATSETINELAEWGAIATHFDPQRRAHVHAPEGNTLSIVATVFRRREQVVLGRFKQAAQSTLEYVQQRYGAKDPRVLTLRSIVSSCEIADAVMQLVFSSVERALGDRESLLARAVSATLRLGMKVPTKIISPGQNDKQVQSDLARSILERLPEEPEEEDEPVPPPPPARTIRSSRRKRA
jgi:DNA-binding transcriptional regulator GbsR (MarR family)